ncbi:hypothetical protein NDU88_001343 [Pleurodeles waltl]|uniref:Uncharacterized protein n=1 Tax=Pleurodeles waltl TaxID=8319 RepID=A0AAV7WL84_PLEWA|nr:hypothetical protein NDU88_001343 [Pleurodeles waltl]
MDGSIHNAEFRSKSAKRSPWYLGEGSRAHRAQILAAIESSSRATQTQIAAIEVDVNLLRADIKVVVERSVATEQQVTCMQFDVDMIKAFVAILESPETAWDWLERNDGTGTQESLRGESGGRLRETAEVRTVAHGSTRCHCAGRGSRVIVRSDGTLSLKRRRQKREEAKTVVQTVTSEASSCSGSPCVTSGLSPEGEAEVT